MVDNIFSVGLVGHAVQCIANLFVKTNDANKSLAWIKNKSRFGLGTVIFLPGNKLKKDTNVGMQVGIQDLLGIHNVSLSRIAALGVKFT